MTAPVNTAPTPFCVQTFDDFMNKKFPPKKPLIEGVLFGRDLISLTGRRRHGKTTLVGNIALAGADPAAQEYLGFAIPQRFTTVAFLLEDDAAELQDKLGKMRNGRNIDPKHFHLYTKKDLRDRKIPKNSRNKLFREFVHRACAAAKPDLVILDNLGMLIGGAYMKPEEIHALMELAEEIAETYDAAALITAHPRKAGEEIISLKENPERFFEECMGSSHFVNSTGSLWGIERDSRTERTTLLLGSQRVTGTHQFTTVEKNDGDWLERVDDRLIAFQDVMTTEPRVKAFSALPKEKTFTYGEAQTKVRAVGVLKSNGSFNPWWKELLRHGLVIEVEKGKYRVKGPAAKPSQETTAGVTPRTGSSNSGDSAAEDDDVFATGVLPGGRWAKPAVN